MTDSALQQRFAAALEAPPGAVHLNNAGVAPMVRAAREAAVRVAGLMCGGSPTVSALLEAHTAARASFGRLVGAPPEQVAMTQTCATAISLVAFGLELRPGDRILRWDQEYPSNAAPWHRAAARAGAEVRVVPSGADHRLEPQRLIDAIDGRCRAVTISWVQWQTGATTALRPLAEACHRHGAWLVVDAIQGLGVIPFDMAQSGADAVCGGTHKWLCGPLGHGFLALAPGRAAQLEPVLLGASSFGPPGDFVYTPEMPLRADARRFEPGAPHLFGAVAGAAAIEVLLDLGIDAINAQAVSMAQRIERGVQDLGARLISAPTAPGHSPIVTFAPRQPADQVFATLQAARISCARRLGGIRVAPHGFTSEADVDRLLEALSSVIS